VAGITERNEPVGAERLAVAAPKKRISRPDEKSTETREPPGEPTEAYTTEEFDRLNPTLPSVEGDQSWADHAHIAKDGDSESRRGENPIEEDVEETARQNGEKQERDELARARLTLKPLPTVPTSLRPHSIAEGRGRRQTNKEHGFSEEAYLQGTPRTVHVTIGRVEVKAVLPPREKEDRNRTARKTPALSLEEYLRERKAGKR
jgi:hypothetical protein